MAKLYVYDSQKGPTLLELEAGLNQADKDRIEAAKTVADAAKTVAETAQSTANNAKTTAETAQSTANTAKTTANTAKTTADTAQSTANTAKTTADAAQSTANTAKTTANTAKTTADAALPKSGGLMSGAINYKTGFAREDVLTANDGQTIAVIQDKNGKTLGHFGYSVYSNNQRDLFLCVVKTNANTGADEWPSRGICCSVDPAGVIYGQSPHPRDNLGADIVTTHFAKNKFPLKLAGNTNIYVGGANASDTADLFCGRGFSPDKPFATLDAAISWALSNCVCGPGFDFILQADMTTSGMYICGPQLPGFTIKSSSVKRTLTLNGPLIIASGSLQLDNINLSAGPNLNCFIINECKGGISQLLINNNVSLNGTVTDCAILATYGAKVTILGAMTGSVTGKRYGAYYCSRIITSGKGPNVIPGTIAGTCDATSVYC